MRIKLGMHMPRVTHEPKQTEFTIASPGLICVTVTSPDARQQKTENAAGYRTERSLVGVDGRG